MKRIAVALLLFVGAAMCRGQSSPYSNVIFPAVTVTGTGTTAPIRLNSMCCSGTTTTGSGFSTGDITLSGTSLTTVTFGVLVSKDNGVTYFPTLIWSTLTPGTAATTVTAAAGGQYEFSLANVTHVEFVVSGTFTATSVQFLLSASPNAQVGTGGSAGGGGSGSTVTIRNVFATAGTLNYQHNLRTANPLSTCYSVSGATPIWPPVEVDMNNVAISSPGAATIDCSFGFAPAPSPNFNFAVTGAPTLYVPTLAATQTIPLTLTQTALQAYTASTTYSLSGLPSGLTGSFATNPITGGSGTSTLTMSFPYNQASGVNSFNVSGVSTGITQLRGASVALATTNTGLIGGYAMTEGSGTTLVDVVAANNATFTSGAATYGVVSGMGSLSIPTFAGTGAAATTNTSAYNFTGSTPFSVAGWVKPTNVTAAHALVSTVSTSAAGVPGWEVGINASGQVQLYIYQTTTTNGLAVASPNASVSAGAAHFIVLTYSGATKTPADVSIYIDGVAKTLTASWNTFTGSSAGAQPVTFGARADNSNALIGSLGYVRIFSRVLSSSEVTTLFSAGPQ